MISLDYTDGNFVLRCPARYRDFAKQIPGLKFKSTEDAYIGPATWTAAQVFQGVFSKFEVALGPEALAWIQAAAVDIQQLRALKDADLPELYGFPSRSGKKLFPWQSQDAFVLSEFGKALDLSDRGTGKGPKIISALKFNHLDGKEVFPHLTITRPFALGAIRDEWLEWFPELEPHEVVIVPHGLTKTQREKLINSDYKVLIVPHAMVPLHSRIAPYGANALTPTQKTPKEFNGKFKSVFVDEAHRLIHRVGQPNVGTRSIWSVLDEVEIKYLATGSPIGDAPDDMWSLLRALWPAEFSSSDRYKTRYCHMVPQFFGPDKCIGLNPANEEEFRQIMAAKFVSRRKEDVLKDLPAKTYETITSEMEGKQLKLYNEFAAKGVLKIKDDVMIVTDALTQRTRKLQLAFGTPVLGVKKGANGDIIAPVELTMPSVKVDALFDTLERFPEKQLIVWVDGRLEFDLIAKQLGKAGVDFVEFKGGMKERDREAGRHTFQAGDARVALCMLSVASEALTLTAASIALYLQREDSMIDSTQSEDRIHRIGQTEEVLVIDHITADTEEIAVHENYLGKEVRSNTALQINREVRTVA